MTYKREVIFPENEAHWHAMRAQDLTSTDIAALFDASPYSTSFELWHSKRNTEVITIEASERMKWGTRLQTAIANGIADDNDWHVRHIEEYMRIPALRLGASFDFEIGVSTDRNGDIISAKPRILEIKNVDALSFREGWLVDGDTIEAPPHIEIQIQHQMLVGGYESGFIGALIGGNTVKLLPRVRNEKVIAAILREAAKFWASIDANQPPTPDFKRDADVIAKLYGYAEPNKLMNADGDQAFASLAARYKQAAAKVKSATEEKDAIKAEILMAIGDHEKVFGEWGSLSAGIIPPADISYTRAAYRNFKFSWKKPKA